MKPFSVLIIGVLCAVLGGVFVYYCLPQVKTEITVTDTDIDSTAIVQKARLGYIPQVEYEKLLAHKVKARRKVEYRIIDSLRITNVLNIKDTTIVQYVPYFEADTILCFSKETLEYDFMANVDLHNRFYPIDEYFSTRATMTNLNITVRREDRWQFDFTSGGLGFGVGALFTGGIVYLTK